jgi:hypothetical protein
MKRSLVLIPIVLLILLNACGTGNEGGGTSGNVPTATIDWNAIYLAETVTNMPPTNPPDTQLIVGTMNDWGRDKGGYSTLDEKLQVLEETIGADFVVLDAHFEKENGVDAIFQVDATCSCPSGGTCCTPEHMFVLTLGQLVGAVNRNAYYTNISPQIPSTVREMQVICWNNRTRTSTISVNWADVQSFLQGQLSGTQMSMRITPGP